MDNNSSYRGGSATKQAVEGRDKRGRFTRGNVPKVGFHTNPERRSNGSWKRELTPRAKLEKMFSEMTVGELLTQINEHNVASNFYEEVGNVLISERLANTFSIDTNGKIKVNSKELDSLLHFVYGTRTENDTSITAVGGELAMGSFVIPTLHEGHIDKQTGSAQAGALSV